jgi:3-oxoacyl-[acyl-carrier-protein] synthase-1
MIVHTIIHDKRGYLKKVGETPLLYDHNTYENQSETKLKKAVITGRGVVTPLGTGLNINEKSLFEGKTGTIYMPEWKDRHLESLVAGIPEEAPECPLIDKRTSRFTTSNGKMALAATYEAINEAGLSKEELKGKKVAVILGVGGSTFVHVYEGGKKLMET